jgi:hypothetical protein
MSALEGATGPAAELGEGAAAAEARGRWVDSATLLLVVAVCGVLFSTPLRRGGDLLPYAQDDLYYYLGVTRHLVRGAGSTFDGSTPTNGYHPLYLLVLWAATAVSSSLRGIYRVLAVLDVASAITIFTALRAMYRRRFQGALLRNGFAAAILYLSFFRLYHQMEVTLTLPLGFLFLFLLDRRPAEQTPRRWAGVGIVAALLTLSRLDAGLLVLLCVAAVLAQREFRETLTGAKVAAFLAGAVPPMAAYFLVNEHFFHRLTPISGAAKQTKTMHGFALDVLPRSLSIEVVGMFALSFVALCLLPWLWRRLEVEQRVICVAALLFPFAHWGITLWMSDWMLWAWYKYSLLFAMSMILLLVGTAVTAQLPSRAQMLAGAGVFVAAVLLLLSARYRMDMQMIEIAQAAEQVRTFAQTHPGRYAMGDRAGMVAYVDGQPMIQTEGLMMDDAFLNRIRRREPLREVLRAYDVDYYIGFDWKQPKNWPSEGCFQAKEPSQAGSSSPVMRGEFCEAPLADIRTTSGRTLIFDVRAP